MKLALTKFLKDFLALAYGRDPGIDQRVDHPRHRLSYFVRILASEVDFARVCVLVPRDSACLGNLLECRRDSDLMDLFVKLFRLVEAFYLLIFAVPVGNHFEADPQKSAGSTGRQTNDRLSFAENFCGVIRHVRRGKDASSDGEGEFSVVPIAEFSTAQATGNETAGMIFNKSSSAGGGWESCNPEFSNSYACSRIGDRVNTNLRIESVYNRKNGKSSFSPAVWAYIGAFHE